MISKKSLHFLCLIYLGIVNTLRVDAQHIYIGHQLSSLFPSHGRLGYEISKKQMQFQVGALIGAAKSNVDILDTKNSYGVRYNFNYPEYTIKQGTPLGFDLSIYRIQKSEHPLRFMSGASIGILRHISEITGVGFRFIDLAGGPDYFRLNRLYDYSAIHSRQVFIPFQINVGVNHKINNSVSVKLSSSVGYLLVHSKDNIHIRYYTADRFSDSYRGSTQYTVKNIYFQPLLFNTFNISLSYAL